MALFSAKFPLLFYPLLPRQNFTYEARSTVGQAAVKQASHSSSITSKASVFQYIIFSILLAYPVIIYYLTIYKNAYNFPYEDDLNSALLFIADYDFGGLSFWEKLKLIFSQYNEHRIVLDRLVFLSDYTLFGQLNFRHLILIGNIAPLLIGFLFIKVPFRTFSLSQKLICLLPVAYSLFSFQYWELSTWSMAALQNLFVIPFALFSLYSLCRPDRIAFVFACCAAVLATYTSGNGLFTFVAGIGLLLLQKDYKKLAIWVLVSTIAIGCYFINYIRPPYHPDIADSLFNHTGRAITYFFTLLGSMVGPGRAKLALLFGIVSLLISIGLIGYLWYQKRLVENLPLLGWITFLYLTCLSLMASRSGMGIGQAFTPRYGIVAVMLFATQAVLAVETITHRYLRLAILLGYSGVSVFFYFSANNQGNGRRIEDRTRQMRYNSALYQINHNLVSLHWGNSDVANVIFKDAVQKGIYKVPNVTFVDLKSHPQSFDASKLAPTNAVTTEVNSYSSGNFLVIYRAWALINNESPRNLTVQIIAKSPASAYAFDTQKHIWDDTSDHTLGRTYAQPGFSCVLDKKDLKPGHYDLWLHLTNGDVNADKPLGVTVDI